MMRSTALLVLAFLATAQWCKIAAAREPICTSRFDFESNLLAKMIQVEFDMAQLKARTSEALAELDKCTRTLKDEQATKLEELSILGNELRRKVEASTKSVEDTRALLPNQFADLVNELNKTKESVSTDLAVLVKEFEEKTDAKWKTIEAQAIKPTVAFVAKTVSTHTPGQNAMWKFTETVLNTGNGYSTSSGYFTAPVDGTYWFSVQMCPENNKRIHVQIRANGSVVASSVMYDSTNKNPCSTVSGVAVLDAGSKVSVYSGGTSDSGDIIYDGSSSDRWAAFSGALVN